MERLWITTVGTSLLSNWKRHLSEACGAPRRLPDDPEEVDNWLSQADASKASAETNTWQAVGLEDSDHVLLLHSETQEGRFCADRLKCYLDGVVRCRAVTREPLTGLGYNAQSSAQRGLKTLIAKATDGVLKAQDKGLDPKFCATGGFKSETAFLTLLGALYKVEVYYIHEQYGEREVVCLPRLPLRWDTEWVLQHLDFFEWIDSEPRPAHEVENRVKAFPEVGPLVVYEDNNGYLNAAGDLLFKATKAKEQLGEVRKPPPTSTRQPDVKNGLSQEEHHRPKGWERYVERLCNVYCIDRVSYTGQMSGGQTVKVLDGAKGVIGVNYKGMGLKVETTAQEAVQTEFIAEYINHCVKE